MAEHRQVPEPGEMVYTARPSWAPIFFAGGAAALICGIFAGGFALPPFIYSIVGAIFILLAFRGIASGAVRDYYRRPRRQEARGAALPVETISGPPQP